MLSTTQLTQIIATSRPKFLLLTPCCLAPALAYAMAEQLPINYLHWFLIVIGGLAAHASVNMFNEYGDFTSGLDLQTQRTPFSGGSGTLPMAPELASAVRTAAAGCLLATLLIGMYLTWASGWGLLLIGGVGVLLIYFYTSKITHNPWMCLIAPGLAFGPLMIGGAYYVLSGQFRPAVLSMSLIVFFLVNNLLLLNQFPDLEADRNAGRRHLPIAIGRKKSAWVYIFFSAAAYAVLIWSVWLAFLPLYSLVGLLSLPFAVIAGNMAVEYADDIDHLTPALALNVAVVLSTPVLVAAGIVFQAQ